MKILYVITKSNWGGAQKYVCDLATEAKRRGHQVAVVLGAPRPDTVESGKGVLLAKLKEADIRQISLWELKRDISIIEDWQAFLKLIAIFKEEKPDVIHLNSSKIGGLASLAGKVAGVPKIIFTVHGWPFKEERLIISRFFIRFLSWLSTILAHQSIIISKLDWDEAMRFPFAENKFVFIRNGIEDKNFPDKASARGALEKILGKKLDSNTLLIGTISELVKNKGLEYLIKGMAFLRLSTRLPAGFQIFIIGGGEEKASLEKLTRELGLDNKIFFLGFQSEAWKLLPAFDIFSLASVKEGLPYVILEAGLARLPIAASAVGEIPQIIENEVNGLLVKPMDPISMAEALEKLLTSQELRQKLGENLRQKIRSEFDRKQMIEKTFDLYQKLVKTNSSGS